MNVIKSKSSNSAITSKRQVNKKSLSNGEIQPLLVKKRGVYVENKFPKLFSKDAREIETKPKLLLRKKPQQNNILASVHKVFSNTASTQYPDTRTYEPQKIKPKKEWKNQTQTKKKYKSRILNQKSYQEERDQLIILQSQRDIIKTPSNYSANENNSEVVKWSKPVQTFNKTSVRDILDNDIYSGVGAELAKEILDGKNISPTIKDGSDTLLDSVPENDDRKIYNFFVDLLKTTFSVYNVKTDYAICEANDGSKLNLEKKQSNINEIKMTDSTNIPFPVNNYNINDTYAEKQFKDQDPFRFPKKRAYQHRINTLSFIPNKLPSIKALPKSYSVETKKLPKRESKRSRQKKFMKYLKNQLAMDFKNYEEPDNLFDALKVLAENKKKRERAPQFYEPQHSSNNSKKLECEFKGHKIMSPKSKKNKKSKQSSAASKHLEYSRNNSEFSIVNSSCHSIEVYGYDYKEDPFKKQVNDRQKQMMFTNHKATLAIDNILNSNSVTLFSDTTLQSNSDFDFF